MTSKISGSIPRSTRISWDTRTSSGAGDYSDPNVVRAETPETRRRGVTRRELLVKGGLGAAALSASGSLRRLGGREGRTRRGERRVHRHPEDDQPRRRVAGRCPGTSRVLPRGQIQHPAPEHERPGPEVDHRAGRASTSAASTTTRCSRSGRPATSSPSTARRSPHGRTTTRSSARAESSPATRRAPSGRVMPRSASTTSIPKGSSGGVGKSTGLPLTHEGPTNNKQLIQWWNEKRTSPMAASPSRSS